MDNEIIMTENGPDVLMKEICGCDKCTEDWTLSDCENRCERYFACNNVAVANDMLADYDKKEDI